MKKFRKILYPLVIISLVAVMLSACGVQEPVFSADKVKTAYISEGFTIAEVEEADYDDIELSEISDLEKVFLVAKDGNSALVAVFKASRSITPEVMAVLRGEGLTKSNYNVVICRYRISGELVETIPDSVDSDEAGINSPEIEALNAPIAGATPDQKNIDAIF